MKKYFITISLSFLILFLIIVSNSKAEKINDCHEKHSSCLEDCREKFDLPEQSFLVEPGKLNSSIKVQRFEVRKKGKQFVASSTSQLRTCRLSSKSNNAERTKFEILKLIAVTKHRLQILKFFNGKMKMTRFTNRMMSIQSQKNTKKSYIYF